MTAASTAVFQLLHFLFCLVSFFGVTGLNDINGSNKFAENFWVVGCFRYIENSFSRCKQFSDPGIYEDGVDSKHQIFQIFLHCT